MTLAKMTSPKLYTHSLRHGDKALIARALGLRHQYITLDSQVSEPRKVALRELLELAVVNRPEFETRLAKYAADFAQPDEHEGRNV